MHQFTPPPRYFCQKKKLGAKTGEKQFLTANKPNITTFAAIKTK